MRKGFTLVEIMIVVAIIALLAAMAIPNLLRARISAQESAAAGAMHTISAAQQSWRATHATYADDLADLTSETPPYIDSTLGCAADPCPRQGYAFNMQAGNATGFWVSAAPSPTATVARNFYIDEDGVLCIANTTAIGNAGAWIQAGCPANYRQMD
ncbi:MAG: prepilin-type N-terminal cleavage/methylation domain-containing protein [Candidatus Omnitrophota bacterium]|nr:MAG: prepilin-type N-terminal cleavage/methylation domain-containing protein [Candidatus Omnitrophota bacterium]